MSRSTGQGRESSVGRGVPGGRRPASTPALTAASSRSVMRPPRSLARSPPRGRSPPWGGRASASCRLPGARNAQDDGHGAGEQAGGGHAGEEERADGVDALMADELVHEAGDEQDDQAEGAGAE